MTKVIGFFLKTKEIWKKKLNTVNPHPFLQIVICRSFLKQCFFLNNAILEIMFKTLRISLSNKRLLHRKVFKLTRCVWSEFLSVQNYVEIGNSFIFSSTKSAMKHCSCNLHYVLILPIRGYKGWVRRNCVGILHCPVKLHINMLGQYIHAKLSPLWA